MPVPDPILIQKQKRFVARITFEPADLKDIKKLNKGDVIRANPEDVNVYVSGNLLVPFNVAVKEGLYPPEDHSIGDKLKAAIVGDSSSKSTSKPKQEEDNKLLGNKLRDMIQEKKKEASDAENKSTSSNKSSTTKSSQKVSQDKLAAIKAGGKKTK